MRGLALALLLGGCGLSGGRTFELQFPGRGLVDPLVVIVEDRAGIVAAIGPGPAGARDGVTSIPGRTDALVVSWLGGMCDRRATLTVAATSSGYTIREQTERADSCLLAGIGRSVVLQLAGPVSAEAVQFISGDGGVGPFLSYAPAGGLGGVACLRGFGEPEKLARFGYLGGDSSRDCALDRR